MDCTLTDNDLMAWMNADPLLTVDEAEWFRDHAPKKECKVKDDDKQMDKMSICDEPTKETL